MLELTRCLVDVMFSVSVSEEMCLVELSIVVVHKLSVSLKDVPSEVPLFSL